MKLVFSLAILFGTFCVYFANSAHIVYQNKLDDELNNLQSLLRDNSDDDVTDFLTNFKSVYKDSDLRALLQSWIKQAENSKRIGASSDQDWNGIESAKNSDSTPRDFTSILENRILPSHKQKKIFSRSPFSLLGSENQNRIANSEQDLLNPITKPEQRQHWSYDLYPGGKKRSVPDEDSWRLKDLKLEKSENRKTSRTPFLH